jgi:hypothetical protein
VNHEISKLSALLASALETGDLRRAERARYRRRGARFSRMLSLAFSECGSGPGSTADLAALAAPGFDAAIQQESDPSEPG